MFEGDKQADGPPDGKWSPPPMDTSNTQGIDVSNLAPILKKTAGSTGKSGASLLTKSGSGGKSSGLGSSTSKSTFGSTSNKSSNFGSTASKSSGFGSSKTSNLLGSNSKTSGSILGSSPSKASSSLLGSSPSKTSAFGSSPSKSSAFGSSASKSTFGSLASKDSRGPSFLAAGSKVPSGHTPSTSRKAYETASYNPKSAKSSTSFGIIWLPGRKRNKKKEMAYSSINNDKKNERTPTMYNVMSGDSPDYQLNKKKEDDSTLLVPEKMKGPIATAASAGAISSIAEAPQNELANNLEEKLLCRDKEDSKEAAGDGHANKDKEDIDYLENKDEKTSESKYPEDAVKTPESQYKSSDKVDSAILQPGFKPPQSNSSNPDEKEKEDCFLVCLYYTLECCDCVLM